MIEAAILAQLDPATVITIQVPAGALLKAMQAAQGGPEWVSTREAAERYGRSSAYWRRRADEWMAEDEGKHAARAMREQTSGRRFLRSESCREHLARKASPKPGGPSNRRVPRGPRKR